MGKSDPCTGTLSFCKKGRTFSLITHYAQMVHRGLADRKLLFRGSRLLRCEPPLPCRFRAKIDLFSYVRQAASRWQKKIPADKAKTA